MTTEQDWRELIDGSIGPGPGYHRPLEERLGAGRRALRRRRIATGVVTAVVTVGLGGAAWGALPSESRTSGEIAGTPDDSAKPDGPNGDGAGSTTEPDLVTWTGSGWKVAPGWTVVDRVGNPVGYRPPKRSVGLELRNGPEHVFALATDDGDGGSGVTSTPVPPGTTLKKWLPAQVDNVRDLDGKPVATPVRFGAGETLVPAEGVTIIEQLPHPPLPANFAAANERTAAAWIDVRGKERFVLVRELKDEEEIIPFTGSFPNLERFVRYAVQQYEGGAGMR